MNIYDLLITQLSIIFGVTMVLVEQQKTSSIENKKALKC